MEVTTMSNLTRRTIATTFLIIGMALAGSASPDSFSVSPISLRVPANQQVTTLTMKATGRRVVIGQVRVMRWKRNGSQNELVPTRDVVASPPALRMNPNQETTIRLVRTNTKTVQGEECYRVLVDLLPDVRQRNQVVKFTIRHSVPLCFGK